VPTLKQCCVSWWNGELVICKSGCSTPCSTLVWINSIQVYSPPLEYFPNRLFQKAIESTPISLLQLLPWAILPRAVLICKLEAKQVSILFECKIWIGYYLVSLWDVWGGFSPSITSYLGLCIPKLSDCIENCACGYLLNLRMKRKKASSYFQFGKIKLVNI